MTKYEKIYAAAIKPLLLLPICNGRIVCKSEGIKYVIRQYDNGQLYTVPLSALPKTELTRLKLTKYANAIF